jgi:hypothetical protein
MIVPVIIDQDDGLPINVVGVLGILPFDLFCHMGQSLDHIFWVRIRKDSLKGRANVWFAVLADSEALAFITVVHVNPIMMISRLEACHAGTTATEIVV